ncbi:MAG: RHS repeat-associated core domain-containing protein [Gammaproteobacteria bacterium]|nr:RHS repeat-associated core domain-containing protein [Gammaproteobacteria bacterium]
MQGTVAERRTFDAFGKPRTERLHDTQTSSEVLLNIVNSEYSNRGFTDHEHLDSAQLIHMNGRAYDYNLGRFLSVDPFIQDPGNSQSMNPYSYIMNNPLAGTDPSGYTFSLVIRDGECSSLPFDCGSEPHDRNGISDSCEADPICRLTRLESSNPSGSSDEIGSDYEDDEPGLPLDHIERGRNTAALICGTVCLSHLSQKDKLHGGSVANPTIFIMGEVAEKRLQSGLILTVLSAPLITVQIVENHKAGQREFIQSLYHDKGIVSYSEKNRQQQIREAINPADTFGSPGGMEPDDPDEDDEYENPGHHDPHLRGHNTYNKTKSVLPKDHESLWRSSRVASDGNRWTKVGKGKKAVYHRFQKSGKKWHWNGSTNGRTQNGQPREISLSNVPIEVQRW